MNIWPSEDISGILPSPVGKRAESPANRIPLAAKSSSMLNRQLPLDSLHRPAQVDKERQRGAHFDTENCDSGTPKRLRMSSIKEFLKAKEVRKRGAQFDDENSEEPKRKRLREDSGAREGLKYDAGVFFERRLFVRSN